MRLEAEVLRRHCTLKLVPATQPSPIPVLVPLPVLWAARAAAAAVAAAAAKVAVAVDEAAAAPAAREAPPPGPRSAWIAQPVEATTARTGLTVRAMAAPRAFWRARPSQRLQELTTRHHLWLRLPSRWTLFPVFSRPARSVEKETATAVLIPAQPRDKRARLRSKQAWRCWRMQQQGERSTATSKKRTRLSSPALGWWLPVELARRARPRLALALGRQRPAVSYMHDG
mmetsp:Transcript_22940/g.52987  ORF Transcript_22940/g.52987 Transcript_22940/m.52987 type:complete len:228 (-) Transcript_22940:516-1199(-)